MAVILLRKSLDFRRWLLLGLGILLIGPQLFALDPSRTIFQYNLQSWNRQNGLPFNRMSAITQTPDGFLWLGTQNGLVRFDGRDFVRSAIPHFPGWNVMSVSSLANATHGGLWFGMDGGNFGYFDGVEHYTQTVGDWVNALSSVQAVRTGPDNSLWIGDMHGVTAVSEGNTNRFFQNEIGPVLAIYLDPSHRLWIGSFEKGLFYWEKGKLNQFPNHDLDASYIKAITMDHEGQLWIGTATGLRCYDRNFKRNDLVELYDEVPVLLTDSHGAVWIGTSGNGLFRYINGHTSSLHKTDGLAEDFINSLYEDSEGSVWVGTRDGLTQISDLKFPIASTTNGTFITPVHGVSATRDNGVLFATGSGLYKYKDKSISLLPARTNSNPYFKRAFEARNGDLYTLSGLRQISIYSQGELAASYTNSDWPTALSEDSQGVIVSVAAQLYRVSLKEKTPFTFKESPPPFYWIRNLAMTADDSLLVASVNGAFRIKDGRVSGHWTTNEGLADMDTFSIVEDGDRTIWVGGPTGLSRIRDNKASVIHLSTPEPGINAIVPDNLGNLWLSCSTGVIRASRKELNDFSDGKLTNPKIELYDGNNSLKTIDLTDVEFMGCKSLDGKIWFGGPLGPVEIDPSNISTNPKPPPVHIQKVVVNGIQQTNSSTAGIRHGGGDLSFQYTAVSFVAPQKIHFRYKLDGHDKDWIDAGTQRYAMYANLPPGKYQFLVRACNADGVWSDHDASFAIDLPPFYYQTLWFKFAAAGFAVLCFLGIYGWRTRFLRQEEKHLQAANELLENKVRERTREVAEQRNLLRTLIDNLPDAVFVKDTDCRVIVDNKAHARYFGFDNPSDAVGKSDHDCLPHERADEFRRDELALLKSGKVYEAEEPLTLKTGETIWLRTTKVPLRNDRGEIVGLAGINRDISERKKWEAELESLHKQLIETSRHAGMAEVATSVLHNVGNVLNSVNVSASIVDEQTRSPNLERLSKVISLLQENRSDLSRFLTQDDKGTKVVNYLDALFVILKKERETVQTEVDALTKNVEHIKKIVSMQQSYARIAGVVELIPASELIEDSLRMHEAAFQRHSVKIVRDFSDVPKIAVDRHKVIQILVNLFGNAKYACEVNPPNQRTIEVRLRAPGPDLVRIEVIDNGMGIAAENLTRVFSYGFTTRKNGHGFGLHSGALAAKEMGGSLHAHSKGAGHGAAFILELPIEHKTVALPPRPVQTISSAKPIDDSQLVSI